MRCVLNWVVSSSSSSSSVVGLTCLRLLFNYLSNSIILSVCKCVGQVCGCLCFIKNVCQNSSTDGITNLTNVKNGMVRRRGKVTKLNHGKLTKRNRIKIIERIE